MKPRTRLQFEVINNSLQLYKIDDEMLSWAKKDILEHKGFATKTRVICMDCVESFSPDLVSRKRAICPNCNAKLKVEQTRKRTDEQRTYVAHAEIFGEFQVIRNFELRSYHGSGKKVRYYIDEILQHWILSNGKREVVARNHTTNWYCDSWNGLMEIRKHYPKYYESSSNKYDVYPQKFHPGSLFKPEYLKYGINKNLEGLTFLEAIKLLPESPMAETLLKAKQYPLLEHLKAKYNQTYRFWASIKICLRNKYFVKDAQSYIDYLDLLRHFGKDLHNAFYVCPKNLKKEHDLLVAKKRRQRDREDAERKREKLLQNEKTFLKLKAMFAGIVFSDGTIKIRALESVKEHIAEGDALHHCVESYALMKDSLILSARIRGKRIETVEVSLEQLKVVQCRGLQNQNSEYHDRILKLVNKNMKLIKERLKPQKNETKRNDRRTIAPRPVAV